MCNSRHGNNNIISWTFCAVSAAVITAQPRKLTNSMESLQSAASRPAVETEKENVCTSVCVRSDDKGRTVNMTNKREMREGRERIKFVRQTSTVVHTRNIYYYFITEKAANIRFHDFFFLFKSVHLLSSSSPSSLFTHFLRKHECTNTSTHTHLDMNAYCRELITFADAATCSWLVITPAIGELQQRQSRRRPQRQSGRE